MNKEPISLVEPTRDQVLECFRENPDICPYLIEYVSKLLTHHKTEIYSLYVSADKKTVGAVLFRQTIFGQGLEIVDQLHVICEGKVIIQKWSLWKRKEPVLPKNALQKLFIKGLFIDTEKVIVFLALPEESIRLGSKARLFDFSRHESITEVEHPLLHDYNI